MGEGIFSDVLMCNETRFGVTLIRHYLVNMKVYDIEELNTIS